MCWSCLVVVVVVVLVVVLVVRGFGVLVQGLSFGSFFVAAGLRFFFRVSVCAVNLGVGRRRGYRFVSS